MLYLIIITILLQSCGADDEKALENNIILPSEETQLAQKNEEPGTPINEARLVQEYNDLGVCEPELEGVLRYVRAEKTFFYCDLNLGWEEIDLKGEKGIDGKNGKDGKNGANGKDGADGQNGVDGINGQDGETIVNDLQKIPDNAWISPINGEMYVLFKRLVIEECPTGYSWSEYEEIAGAHLHFDKHFIYKVDGFTAYYIQDGYNRSAVNTNENAFFEDSELSDSVMYLVCRVDAN